MNGEHITVRTGSLWQIRSETAREAGLYVTPFTRKDDTPYDTNTQTTAIA